MNKADLGLQVAVLAAYVMGLGRIDSGTGRTALDVKNYLWNVGSWQRRPRQPRVIWNGESGARVKAMMRPGNDTVSENEVKSSL